MKRIMRGLFVVSLLFLLPPRIVQAQTCPADPVTGIMVAQMISPAGGSTLQPNPDGSITFTWCNASADYFVIIESVPGAHDIFFAFTGGAGGGAGQNFLTLGPACATSPPIQCIPPKGEAIYFTLDTVKSHQILGSFQYTFTAPDAPAPPAATTTTVHNASAAVSAADQNIMLTATVSAASTVNQGTVTFQVMNGTTKVGASVTSAALATGSASVAYLLPGGTAAGDYTIQANYSGGTNFEASSGSGSLTLDAALPLPASTATTVDPRNVAFSTSVQNVTLAATVTAATAVNEGTVTFQVMDGSTTIGSAVPSATLTNGIAGAIYALPAGLPVASYTIEATFSGGPNFQPSSGSGILTVRAQNPVSLVRFVPIVLDVTGFAHYTSELQLTNLGSSGATVKLSYTSSIGAGSGDVLETVPSGQQVVHSDAIAYLRTRGIPIPASGNQGGTLVVSTSTAGVCATVRTGSDTVLPQPAGRAGLAYNDTDTAPSSVATRQYVYGLRASEADRSNLAVYNMGPDPVSLRVALVSGEDGNSFEVTGGQPLTLPAYGWFQYGDGALLRKAAFSSGYAVVERVAGSGPFGAYGVINDQLTNDGSFIPALSGTFMGSKLTVPVLVETGAFESELILTNRGNATATFTLRYFESLSPAKGPGGTTTVDVAAGRQTIIPNAIDFLRSKGVAIGVRGEAGYAGSLQIQVSGVGFENVFAGARTSSLSPAGGEFGLFYSGIGSSQEFSDAAFILGLKSDVDSRSNVAAIHTGAEGSGPITLEFQVLDGSDGGTAVGQSLSVNLNPGEWAQPSGFFASSGVANGYVRIRRTAGTAPWYTYGVINDGGRPGQRTGDGSYLPGVHP